jgi:hypothetical protein
MARFLNFVMLRTERDRAALNPLLERHPSPDDAPVPTGEPGGMQAWRDWLRRRRIERPPQRAADFVPGAWVRWEVRIRQLIEDGAASDARLVYDDLVLAAGDTMPSRVMCTDLKQIGPLDWSELALAGCFFLMPEPTSFPRPHWPVMAGLSRLGFGRNFLVVILEKFGFSTADNLADTGDGWAIRLATEAPAAADAILVILSDDAPPLERDDPGPYLFIRDMRVAEYADALRWLTDIGAFRRVIDER